MKQTATISATMPTTISATIATSKLTLISVCQYLINQNGYQSQQDICRDLRQHGFASISQASVSRLLKRLGVTKVRNARGIKVYCLTQPAQTFHLANSVAEMVIKIDHNEKFILIQTLNACANYIAKLLAQQNLPHILGIIAGNDTIWVTLNDLHKTTSICQQIKNFFLSQQQPL